MLQVIENLQLQEKKIKGVDTQYYTFWVRFMVYGDKDYVVTGGWRYFPAKRSVSTPSIYKGSTGGRYMNITKVPASIYDKVLTAVETSLGMPNPGQGGAQGESQDDE